MVLTAQSGLAFAGEPWLRPSQLPERRDEISMLKTLRVTPRDLVFRGEAARHAWPVSLDRDEARRITRFQFGYLNAVSVLPRRSRLTVSINDRSVAEIVADSAGTPSLVSIALPPGLVLPGLNTVTIATALAPGGECSTNCDLWAELEPALSGFVLEGGPTVPAGLSDDLPGAVSAPPAATPLVPEPQPDKGAAVALRRLAAVDSDLTGSGFELERNLGGSRPPDVPPRLDAQAPGESQPAAGSPQGQGSGPGRLALMVLMSTLGTATPAMVRSAGPQP